MFGFQGVLPFQDPKKPLIQKKYWEAEKDLVGVYKDGKRPNTRSSLRSNCRCWACLVSFKGNKELEEHWLRGYNLESLGQKLGRKFITRSIISVDSPCIGVIEPWLVIVDIPGVGDSPAPSGAWTEDLWRSIPTHIFFFLWQTESHLYTAWRFWLWSVISL